MLAYLTVRVPLFAIAPPLLAKLSGRQLVQEFKFLGPGHSRCETFLAELTDCHGVRTLFGHPTSISSPIVQVHVVVWKGEAAELWVKRCAPLNPYYVPGRDFEHFSARALAMGAIIHTP